MNTLLIIRGLPGTGKITFASEWTGVGGYWVFEANQFALMRASWEH